MHQSLVVAEQENNLNIHIHIYNSIRMSQTKINKRAMMALDRSPYFLYNQEKLSDNISSC